MSPQALSRELATAVTACAEALEAETEQHAIAVTEAIDRAIDAFDHRRAFTAHTLSATRSSFHAFCALLRVDEPLEINAPPEAAANARAYVRRGIPLRVLVRCYQVGHGEMWRAWQATVRAQELPPDLELEVLDHSSRILFALIEQLTDEVVDVYEREQQRWSRSMAAIREDTVKQLLAEAPIDLEKAEQTLVYDLRGQHVAAVLWTADGRDRSDALDAAWKAFIEVAGGRSATAIIVGSRVLWGWLSVDVDRLADLRRAAEDWEPPQGIQVAFGDPGRGVSGFRASHAQALHARRVAELAGFHEPVVHFGDVAVPALVTADPALAAAFVRRELGALDTGDKLAHRLRVTLEAYFAERESPAGAARRIGVHVNTVIYRLRQAEELLGVAPSERRLELELALLIERHLTPDSGED